MKYEKTAKRLRKAMQAKGLTSQELSRLSGVGKSSISHYVNGNNEPSNRTAEKLARVLDVEPLWLMGFDTDTIEQSERMKLLERLSIYSGKLSTAKIKMLADVAFTLSEEEKEDKNVG